MQQHVPPMRITDEVLAAEPAAAVEVYDSRFHGSWDRLKDETIAKDGTVTVDFFAADKTGKNEVRDQLLKLVDELEWKRFDAIWLG
jgi:hypothetical protein